MLERLARQIPDAPLLSDLGEDGTLRTLTAAALLEEVFLLGDGLLAGGLGQAHVAIVSRNCSRYFVTLLSVLCGDAVAIPIDAQAPQPLLGTLLDRCDADAVFCDLPSLPRVLAAQKDRPRIRTVVTLEGKVPGLPSYEEILAAGSDPAYRGRFRTLEPDPDALRVILFSSGTTGANKGVMLSQANLLANFLGVVRDSKSSPDEHVTMSLIPLHHAACIAHTLCKVAVGRHNCFCGDLRDAVTLFRIARPDRTMAVPVIIESFYRQISAGAPPAGLSRYFTCVGAPLRPELIRKMGEAGIRVQNFYGATECGPAISLNMDTEEDPYTVGRPLSGTEIRLDDVDAHGVGTLHVRGKSVALGYYKDPEATRAVFGPDGFFNTGDSVRLDERGRIVLMGRKANTIVLPNGENVYPEELERLVCGQLDYVAEALVYPACFRIGNASRTVLCAGLYIPDPARRADRARIGADLIRINRELPAFKRIEYAELPGAPYPKTASHKLLRTGLPEDCSQTGILLTER